MIFLERYKLPTLSEELVCYVESTSGKEISQAGSLIRLKVTKPATLDKEEKRDAHTTEKERTHHFLSISIYLTYVLG
jgi:hypothetical protein